MKNSPHSSPAPAPPLSSRASAALRVPAATAAFWIVKVLTTGVGETTSDFLVKTSSPVLVALLAGVVFAVLFAAPGIGYRIGLPAALSFWAA